MKQLFLSLLVLLAFYIANAQNDTLPRPIIPPSPPKKQNKYSQVDLSNRSNDHFMFQIGYDSWAGKPDSIHTKGLSRSFNVYLMFDFPFKTDPRFSVGIGAGVGTGNIYFDKMNVEVAGSTSTLRFRNLADTNHFKKYKLATAYVEAPVELRFAANPANTNKSFKLAIGAKVGLLLSAHNKGRILLNKDGGTVNNYVQKESSKKYFNGNRICVIGRVGYGVFGLFGSYQINTFIKEGVGPNVHPYSIGLTISGL